MNRIRQLRKRRNMTQEELAEVLNVSSAAISLWETNNRQPDYNTLEKIANLFNVSVDYLYPNKIENNPLTMDDIQFALYGAIRKLDEEDMVELLKSAERMQELKRLKQQKSETE